MTNCIFDIETAPLPETDIHNLAPKFEAPANFKDPEKIAANLADQKKAWLERAALSPLTGTVAAIGLKNKADQFIMLVTDPAMNESALIMHFWDYFRAASDRTMFVGFNIFRFDLPFLMRRSWKLGISIPLNLRSGRYFSNSFVDLMEVWQNGNREERISLDTLAKFLGVGAKSGSGADFYKLPAEQQREYLAHDLQLTLRCAHRLLGLAEPTLL